MIIIGGSVAFGLRAFIVCWDFDFIPSLWSNLCSKSLKVRWKEICYISMGHSMQAVLLNRPVGDQIRAHNLKGLAERNFPYGPIHKSNQ